MSNRNTPPAKLPNRWFICPLGVALQICLGTTYAWSYFRAAGRCLRLVQQHDRLGVQPRRLLPRSRRCLGRLKSAKYGPSKLAVAGGILASAT